MRTEPLPVEADHLLVVGDDAALEDGRAVGVRAGSPSTPIPARPSCSRSQLPSASSPTTPPTSTAAPRRLRLCATLAAPPNRCVSSATSTTGTGASGEMRRTDAGIVAVDHQVADHEDPGPRKAATRRAAGRRPGPLMRELRRVAELRSGPARAPGTGHATPGRGPGVQGTASSKIITGMSSVTGYATRQLEQPRPSPAGVRSSRPLQRGQARISSNPGARLMAAIIRRHGVRFVKI